MKFPTISISKMNSISATPAKTEHSITSAKMVLPSKTSWTLAIGPSIATSFSPKFTKLTLKYLVTNRNLQISSTRFLLTQWRKKFLEMIFLNQVHPTTLVAPQEWLWEYLQSLLNLAWMLLQNRFVFHQRNSLLSDRQFLRWRKEQTSRMWLHSQMLSKRKRHLKVTWRKNTRACRAKSNTTNRKLKKCYTKAQKWMSRLKT